MSRSTHIAGRAACALLLATFASAAAAQKSVDTSQPIVVRQKPPKKTAYAVFQGTVMNATIAQITVHGVENELAVRTFPLSSELSQKMQQIVNKGGYQYGDRVKIWYDPTTEQAVKIKGKPSRPI